MESSLNETNGSTSGELTDRALAGWEIVSVTSSVLIAAWLAELPVRVAKSAMVVPIALALSLAIFSHRLRREHLRDLGFRLDNFGRAIILLIPPMALISVVLLIIGWLTGHRMNFLSWHVERPLLLQLAVGIAWGFLQQYILQGYVNRRAQIIWGKGWLSVTVVAIVFSFLHLPNPWLMVITFVGGVVWATIYQNTPNLFALAISHSIMTWILVSALPPRVLQHLRVGLKYFS